MKRRDHILILNLFAAAIMVSGCIGDGDENEDDEGNEDVDQSHIIVIKAEGTICSSKMVDLHLYLDLVNSKGIDMTNVVISISNPSISGGIERVYLLLDPDDPSTPSDEHFGIIEVIDGPDDGWNVTAVPPRFIFDSSAMLKAIIDLNQTLAPLPPNSKIEIDITNSVNGWRTIEILVTPSVYPKCGQVLIEN